MTSLSGPGKGPRPRRQRVDWDAEIQKTERIRRRGLIMSGVSFAVASAFIIGVWRMGGEDIALPRKVISVLCLAAACLVFRAVLKHRAHMKNRTKTGTGAQE
ncbi:MAG: hypothetical protein K6E38_07335 [Fretibacterium sp.]|nr:hypothetical protein [Fretibacterium sp.]